MKTLFSKTWNSSVQPRKQRKYMYNAPLHIRRTFMSANLAKDLRKEFARRSAVVAVGDVVKIMRGDFANQKGTVERTDLTKLKVYVKDVKRKKINGTEILVPLSPSNLQIVELNRKDDKRVRNLKMKQPAAKAETKAAQKK